MRKTAATVIDFRISFNQKEKKKRKKQRRCNLLRDCPFLVKTVRLVTMLQEYQIIINYGIIIA